MPTQLSALSGSSVRSPATASAGAPEAAVSVEARSAAPRFAHPASGSATAGTARHRLDVRAGPCASADFSRKRAGTRRLRSPGRPVQLLLDVKQRRRAGRIVYVTACPGTEFPQARRGSACGSNVAEGQDAATRGAPILGNRGSTSPRHRARAARRTRRAGAPDRARCSRGDGEERTQHEGSSRAGDARSRLLTGDCRASRAAPARGPSCRRVRPGGLARGPGSGAERQPARALAEAELDQQRAGWASPPRARRRSARSRGAEGARGARPRPAPRAPRAASRSSGSLSAAGPCRRARRRAPARRRA